MDAVSHPIAYLPFFHDNLDQINHPPCTHITSTFYEHRHKHFLFSKRKHVYCIQYLSCGNKTTHHTCIHSLGKCHLISPI